jgi:hypothetical protein
VRFTEHEGERDNKKLITLVVTHMQNPVTPIFEATFAGERAHDTRCMIARLCEIVHYGAVIIDENLLRVGTVEIYLCHVEPLEGRPVLGREEPAAASPTWGNPPGDQAPVILLVHDKVFWRE